MSKPWAIGDWAAEAERAEEEEKARAAEDKARAAAAPSDAFPSLSESVATKPRKKKQLQTFSISEFTFGKSVSHGSRTRAISDSRGLTTPEMMMLPSGPRDRSGEEDFHGGLGGAFRDYRGGDHRGGPDRFDREQDRGIGYGGGYERNRDVSGFLRDREQDEPSRADGSHDWKSSKRSVLPQGGPYDGERRGSHDGERRGSRLGDADLPPSRADEVENWGLVKKSQFLALDTRPGRRSDVSGQQLRADEVDNWTSTKKAISPSVVEMRVQSRADEAADWSSSKRASAEGRGLQIRETNADAPSSYGRSMQQEAPANLQRRPVVLSPQSHHRSSSPPPVHINADISNALPPLAPPRSKSNPFGSARPREEVLANRGPDVMRVETEPGTKERDTRPSSSHSSRPDTPEVSVEPAVKPRSKVNPFGNAKPREVVLQEKGKDWRKFDFELEHRGVDRPETQEEVALKEEIRILTELSKQEVETNAQRMNGDDAKLRLLSEELRAKEKELQQLIMMLDDNVRFSQKFVERPASRPGRGDVGRSYEFSERSGSRPGSRPGSRSGRSDTGSNYDPSERPGSVPARRNLDASDRMHSLSGHGGGRGAEVGERPWSRLGQVEGTRNEEAGERRGSWSAHKENRSSSEALQRPRWWAAEVGGGTDYSHQAGGSDIWIRGNEGGRDRQSNWRKQEWADDRAGMRRF